jgi:uncharacterized SAM-binding protein YcdF (DUF218 family)
VIGAVAELCAVLALLAVASVHRRLPPRARSFAFGAPALLLVAALASTAEPLVVQKWLGFALMPTALLWFALLGGAALLLARGERRLGAAAAALAAAYWCANSTWVGVLLLGGLERDFVGLPAAPAEPYDAVLVLGGGTSVRPDGRAQLSHSGDRLATAASVYHRDDARLLVCSGSAIAGLGGGDRSLARDAGDVLGALAVPADGLLELPGPRNTSEEIAAFAALARERGWARLGVVTSAWHMRRALALAERAELDIAPIPADFRGGELAVNVVELLPSANGAYLVRLALWEHIGRAVGR